MSEPEEQGGERMLRDMERWKDRVEVSLDNRQVFFLFFGSAVVACLIFVLGVMVGKRLEARARDQVVPMKSDPLAALDQAGDESDEKPQPKAPPAAPKIAPKPAIAVAPKQIEPPKVEPKPALLPKLEPRPAEPPKAEVKLVEPKPEPKAEEKAEPKPEKAETKPESVSAEKLASASKAAGRYTLQLSAFQERSEADEFAKKLSGTGYKANIVAADIPGRGVWYRVRVGDFTSQKAALDAKADIERKLHIIAYVTKL